MGQSPDGSTYSQIPSDYILVQGNADLKDGWVYPRIWTTQKTKMAEAGDLIMSVRAPAGTMGKTYYDVVIGRGVAGIKGSEFIYQALVKMDSNGYWKILASGSTFESINSDVVNGAELMVTENIDEQNKIGYYLASIDHLITLHQSKSFGHILKAIVSCTLSWEQRKLGEIADKVVEKNFQLQERDVFTNSAEFGIIDQKNFFDHEIVNKNNIGGYYIVSPNDFVYNPRISVTAPVGPINRNKLCKRGIMSPLYTVFHPRNMNETFLEFYFRTNKWHKFMEYNGDSGARSDRFSIKTELFYAMTIPFPSHKEQSKVGICFESLDNLITLHQLEPFQLIFKAIAYRIIDYTKSKPPSHRK
ncbi:restriction endonuclease subunit S domain-containing protein [Lachnoanaerobaculum umeaense]|uniref:Restriction endonuclease subunit S n=2 Tax=Lachnoanaerobaculum umeaense TaxID=617123 RepID=A0A385Q0B0_9FIRM|nr:restriction endonuclease subunit S [Lachnoanaerobaculum umeaense]AYA99635.1 restriction endonuclease subunit S [Lachnoanaerobaculum umeaense]PZW98654.1 type I restriction enzyme S subunit [Lachnoanaerobaculum umeaense]